MKLVIAVTVVLAVVCGAKPVSSYGTTYNRFHGPFEDNANVTKVALDRCDRLAVVPGERPGPPKFETFGLKDRPDAPRLQIERGSKGRIVRVLDRAGVIRFGPQVVTPRRGGGTTVLTADLNRDRRPDFVVQVLQGGCGLHWGWCHVIFVLSDKDGYQATTVGSMFPGPEDYVDLRNDGRCQFVQASFVYGEPGRDGKKHNYWVYHLLEVEGDEVRLADGMDRRFPRWVWYTYKPNHKDTIQLTNEQKRRLYEPKAKQMFWTPPRDETAISASIN